MNICDFGPWRGNGNTDKSHLRKYREKKPMTTSPDTLERIVAELRESARMFRKLKMAPVNASIADVYDGIADRLEKLPAASVQDKDRLNWLDGQRSDVVGTDYNGEPELLAHAWCIQCQQANVRAAIDALRLSPQGEDHGR